MYTPTLLTLASVLALANAHGQILSAVGVSGKSVGFQVNEALARNCTNISPCQQDATIIRQAEIDANIVNQCGRTELSGNIDVGENTENALAAGAVTQVVAGTKLKVTIHQVNADGAGPYVCDIDPSGNANLISANLTVTDNVPGTNGFSQAKEQDFVMTVELPADMVCMGGSTGNICTVRCRNNALAGPFGGCFAVQQTDVKPNVNDANTITTAQTLEGIEAQVLQDQKDLPAAVKANQNAGTSDAEKGAAAVNALLGITVTSLPSAAETPAGAIGNSEAKAAEAKKAAAAVATGAATPTGAKGKGAAAAAAAASSSSATATATPAPAAAGTAKKGKNDGANGTNNNNDNNNDKENNADNANTATKANSGNNDNGGNNEKNNKRSLRYGKRIVTGEWSGTGGQ